MARFLVGAAIGALVTLVAGAALGIHAQDEPEVEAVADDNQPDALDAVLDCISYAESRNVPTAVNPRSGAAGLFQFLPTTWNTTPQGRAGLSPFEPWAARAAARWMLDVGRSREFATYWGCR